MVGGRFWTRSARQCVAAVLVVLGVAAGCGGGGDGAVQTGDEVGSGALLVDADGRTLYVAEQESDGTVQCVDSCLEVWQPLTVEDGVQLSSDDGLSESLSTTKRPEGKLQVTFDGAPLYTFAEDRSAGDVKGNAVVDEFGGMSFTWHAITTSGPARSTSPSEDDGGGGGYGY